MSLLNNTLALLEGMALIASPCILPVLPLVLSTSLEGGRARPLGITVGFIASFCLFAFFSRWLVLSLHIDLEWIKYGSIILLGLLGIIMISEFLTEKFSAMTQGFADLGSQYSGSAQGGFFSGLGIGALIGLIWTPCAGPILAAVLVQVIREQNTWASLITLLCFAIGAGIPMLIIAWTGRALMNKLQFFKQHAKALRKGLGVLILLSVFFIASGADPSHLFASSDKEESSMHQDSASLINALSNPYPAPELAGIEGWFNSKPLTLSQLKGKVVLIDFWTYSCINCVRTLPYVTGWDKKYRDKGLVIIGVHAPEFEFEKNPQNIQQAIEKNHIAYPVAMDNTLTTWANFNNRYWPAQYLINPAGEVVYTHFGEGDDEITEHNIRTLLGITGEAKPSSEAEPSLHFNQSPETYLGYARAERFLVSGGARDAKASYQFPASLPSNYWGLQGDWMIEAEKIISAGQGSALRFHFNAQKVFLVMGTQSDKPVSIKLLLDGKPLKTLQITNHTLYELVDLHSFGTGLLEIQVEAPGLEIYAFTFG